jgi:hypothetical protein
MSNAQQPAPSAAAEATAVSPLLRKILANRQGFRGALFLLAALFFAYPAIMLLRHGMTFRMPYLYAVAMGLASLVVAVLDAVVKDEDEALQVRLELMLLGGLLGLFTALFGLGLWFFTYREEIAGGLEKWRENWGALAWPALALLGGLALMFLSVQLVRGMERRNQTLRRTIYGYNVVLTTLLLVAVLTLPNVLAYAEPFTRFFGRPFDWTESKINAISAPLRNMLTDLRQPVKAYLIMPRGNLITQDMTTVLENCRGLTPKFTWELLDPTRRDNRDKVLTMMQTYNIGDPSGLLVVVESESDKGKPDFAFLKSSDLADEIRGGRTSAVTYTFLGENALLKTLQWLTEGKMVIYFTQGHGEMKIEPGPPQRMPGRRQEGDSLSTLRSRLTDRKGVEVKPLTLDASTKAIPDDASVVVIARPTRSFGKAEVDALRNYVRRNATTKKAKDSEKEEEAVTAGKLFLLLDPVIEREGDSARFARTGLEEFLAENNVKLGMNRILSPDIRPPTGVVCWTAEDSPNPVARAFHLGATSFRQFVFLDARTVDPLAPDDRGGGPKVVQPLMETLPGIRYWAETDANRDPTAAAAAINNDPTLAEKRLSKGPLTIAVATLDSGAPPGMPRDMAHAGLQKDTPRMVVFGSAGWLSNERLEDASGRVNVDLFNSCVQWLREKSSLGVTIEGKKRKEYDPNLLPQDAGRVLYLPLGLLLLSVVGLGLGVWVVRRR